MKKIILLTALAGFFCFSRAHAQRNGDGARFGIGGDLILPVGSFGESTKIGTGGSLLLQLPLATDLRLTVGVAYLTIEGKEKFVGIKNRERYVPIKTGLKYFFTENIYGAGELGVALSTANGSGSGTAFAYSPGIGVEFPVAGAHSVDVGLRFEGWSRSNGTRSFLGLRAGFNF
jgi:hypothetical protein